MPSSPDWIVATVVTYVTTYLLHSTLLLGATWLAMRGLRIHDARLNERLWKLAAVAAVMTTPLQLGSDFSHPVLTVSVGEEASSQSASFEWVGDWGKMSLDTLKGGNAEPLESSLGELTGPVAPFAQADAMLSPSRLPGASGMDGLAAVTAGQSPFTQPRNGVLSAFLILLSIVFMAGLLRFVSQMLVFRRRLSGTRLLCAGRARVALDGLLRQLSIHRSVDLLSSNNHSEPAAFGVWQWRIVLPATIEDDLPSDELTALLAHELAHLVRGDTFWLWVGHLLCSCCAFQPLNFLARREWRRAARASVTNGPCGKA